MNSEKKSTVRRLREEIGLSQSKFADLCQRTIHTIQAIEQGKLPLSDELAFTIHLETGVDKDWLLTGHPTGDIVRHMTNPERKLYAEGKFSPARFTKESFLEWRSKTPGHTYWSTFEDCARLIALSKLPSRSKERALAKYRISECLNHLEEEFGRREEAINAETTILRESFAMRVDLRLRGKVARDLLLRMATAADSGKEFTIKKEEILHLGPTLHSLLEIQAVNRPNNDSNEQGAAAELAEFVIEEVARERGEAVKSPKGLPPALPNESLLRRALKKVFP